MSEYTIKAAAEMMCIPASTIRYYDKEGLLPFMQRKDTGYRVFTEKDLNTLKIINCLKRTGMSIKDIKQFTAWVKEGDATLKQRHQMFLDRRKAVLAQMQELQNTLEVIDYKCSYYEAALEAGTEAVHHTDHQYSA